MSADRYALLILSKGATVHECQDCGTVTFHRAIHDAWHATHDEKIDTLGAVARHLLSESLGLPDTRNADTIRSVARATLAEDPDNRTN